MQGFPIKISRSDKMNLAGCFNARKNVTKEVVARATIEFSAN